ncbi:MAG: hypothetical protein L0G27_10815 [Paracoccus sp. (in: a-proteobacteria)]|nr:hypothetical protein [Paracoccus sp. (in: a-proteobacteria)]
MTLRRSILASLVVLTTVGASPVLADKDHHRGRHDKDHHQQVRKHSHKKDDHGRHLALGHDTHRDRDYDRHAETRRHARFKAGDRFSRNGFANLRNPSAHGLERRSDWEYYRDGNQAYRVDSKTQRVLMVLDLINAVSN